MSFRTSLALNVAPLCLRLALASTFIWAGMGKVAFRTTISDPQDIAQLTEWGIVAPQSAAVPAPPLTNPETAKPETTPDKPTTLDPLIDNIQKQIEDNAPEKAEPPAEPPAEEDVPQDDPGAADPGTDEGDPAPEDTSTADGSAMPVAFQAEMQSVEVKRVMGLALLIHHAANPGVDEQGNALTPLWPAALAKGTLPVVFAWVAGILELVCGAAMLIGFFTRLAALPLAGTMLTAMWLTQIGPAIQHGTAVYGFLPPGMFEYGAGGYVYTVLLWQFALLMAALAMLLIGPGALSIDRLIFGGPSTRFDEPGTKRQVEFVPMGE